MENIINYVRTIESIDKDVVFVIVASLLARNIDLVVETKNAKIALRVS